MLKISKLTKIYRPSKGAPVTALDGVDLELPERGLIFLLGKSGSGKSTLLNLIGGLDSATSGDITVKGKSSGEFKSVDYDSYRNTYVGFIFQEFHILEEYSIEQNISLAVELQNKKSDPALVDEILAKVELDGYAKRKSNELSGGQKQRVAIARALIKNPDIILADEPTGALDSVTGSQIFDVLKSLSLEKLVIVVSHDRENAERYADRIIELKDGKVISDVSRSLEKLPAENAAAASQAFRVLNSAIIQIKKGYRINPSDMYNLNQALDRADSENAPYPEFEEIASDNQSNTRTFKSTDYKEGKRYGANDYKTVRSRLPLKMSAMMGLSNLKLKKLRLAFTIFLTLIALIAFGFSDVLRSYDYLKTELKTAYDMNADIFTVKNADVNSVGLMFGGGSGYVITPEDLAYIEQKSGQKAVIPNSISLSMNYNYGNITQDVYPGQFSFIEAGAAELNALGVSILPASGLKKGRLPENYNEIVIPEIVALRYLGQTFLEQYDLNAQNGNPLTNSYKIERYDDLIGLEISSNINNDIVKYKIVGIARSLDAKKLNTLLDTELIGSMMLNSFQDSFYSCFIAKKGLSLSFGASNNFNTNDATGWYNTYLNIRDADQRYGNSYIYYLYPQSALENSTPLGDKEILLNYDAVFSLFYRYSYDYNLDHDLVVADFTANYITARKSLEFFKSVTNYSDSSGSSTTQTTIIDNVYAAGIIDDFKATDSYPHNLKIYFQESYYGEIIENYYPLSYEKVYIRLSGNLKEDSALVNKLSERTFELDYQDYTIKLALTLFSVNNGATSLISSLSNILGKVLLVVSIVFMVFSALLLMNFISFSVANKKKQIGILRAIGARSFDVFKIFFTESLTVAALNLILACIAVGIGCAVMNAAITLNLLNFGIRQIALLTAIVTIITFIATFIPVYRFALKKPIDAINNK